MFYLLYFSHPTEANSLLVQVLEVIKMYTVKTTPRSQRKRFDPIEIKKSEQAFIEVKTLTCKEYRWRE